MNSFFFKNLISLTSNNHNQDEEQSDFQRLIELCNSYGLNEQQTKQLISEFKKGSYKSGTNSLNQSMVSEQHNTSMNENGDESDRNYQYSQTCSLEPSRTLQQQKHPNPYEEQQNYSESQISNRYYGYNNEIEEKNEESYNQMTFNEQNNSLMLNSHRFHDGQANFNMDSKANTLKQEFLLQNKIHQRPIDKPLQTNNSRKQTLLQKRPSNQLNQQNPTQFINNSEPLRNFKESISNKTLCQQHDKKSQKASKYSQNSMQSHQIENQPANGLNPQYIKALIRNFEILEGQNQALKEQNFSLKQKTDNLTKQCDLAKMESDRIKKQLQEIKNQQKFSSNQTAKFQALYEAEKQKNQMLLSMKQKDSDVIKGLKDSVKQLTELIKEKDNQNNQLQQRLFNLYEKFQNQSLVKYIGSQMSVNEFDQTEGSSETYFGKSFSKKSLVISESEKSFKPQAQDETKQRNSNYGRKELNEIMGSNINLPQNNRSNWQEGSKQLAREPSASRLNVSTNDQGGYKKQSVQAQQIKDQGRESKQNVFAPLQVQPAIKRNIPANNKTSQQDKKRPSSRVDIKKYKGMIQELRSSYSNVANGNQVVR